MGKVELTAVGGPYRVAGDVLAKALINMPRGGHFAAVATHLLFGTLGNSATYIKDKTVEFKNTVQVLMENKGVIVENLLSLTFLYLGVFVIQVLVLPILIFWLLMRIVNSLFLTTTMTTMVQPEREAEILA